VPLDGLIDAVNAVLAARGQDAVTYGLRRPQGYLLLREFSTANCSATPASPCLPPPY